MTDVPRLSLDDLPPGRSASFSKTLTESDVVLFAGITGDLNPVHVDEVTARASRFEGRVVHGMLAASLISTVLGMKLPGPGTVYLGQTLRFTRPVRIGDTVKATATVASVDRERRRVRLETVCTNQVGEVVVKGEAEVLV
ncbi:MAG: MaoC family dehydratase [Gemmatimonadales bacterium]|nr:MAG: MaoC family dehydratase [Gemmatimonadales bacterium]